MTTRVQTVSFEQTVRLLAMRDADILGEHTRPELYGPLSLGLIEFIAIVSSPQGASWASFLKIWRVYKETKKRMQQASGSVLAKGLAAAGGRGLCDEVDYCKNKARLKELFDFADSPEGAKVFAEGAEAALKSDYKDAIEKLQEVLAKAAEVIAEATKEVAEEVADNVVPISFVFMTVKYSMDELCQCCEACEGTGVAGTTTCQSCDGKGHHRP